MTCVTGDDTGLVKVWDITRSSAASLKHTFGSQSRTRGVASMCWVDKSTTDLLACGMDGIVRRYDGRGGLVRGQAVLKVQPATAAAMNVVGQRLVVVGKTGRLAVVKCLDESHAADDDAADDDAGARLLRPWQPSWGHAAAGRDASQAETDEEEGDGASLLLGYPGQEAPVSIDAVHIHRRFQLMATAGKDTQLAIWDVASERFDKPLFLAANVRDHVLDVPYPVYNTGVCIVSSHVFCVCTAFHQVRFYDRRASERPVQEFPIAREIQRRPTSIVQWNSNKFLIGEASGDIHLYDTRRGFASRAKMRGVGSVRHIVKHPAGYAIIAAIGLDRKVRIYHVPTGKLLSETYIKQQGTCALLAQDAPFLDDVASYTGVVNAKAPETTKGLGDALWDTMVPVTDDFEDDANGPSVAVSTPGPDTGSEHVPLLRALRQNNQRAGRSSDARIATKEVGDDASRIRPTVAKQPAPSTKRRRTPND